MLEAAVSGLSQGSGAAEAGILGVSVLTSLDQSDFERIGISRTPGQLVGRMAKLASQSGCEGVVCSPQELNVVAQSAPNLMRVTPGIRPISDDTHDQARVATPAVAIEKGADMLVIGRPITAAQDPAAAARTILNSL
jgi:orotidine-5'-phosphate decarboxylase